MTQSMTAFARNEVILNNSTITLEIRSVNHRYLDITVRSPDELRETEAKLRALISSKVNRGKVELNIRVQNSCEPTHTDDIDLNLELVAQLSKASDTISQQLKQNNVDVDKCNPLEILRWPGVMQTAKLDTAELHKNVIACLDEAINDFIESRKREGGKLAAMLVERCDAIEKITSNVTEIIPAILDARTQKVRTRLTELKVEHDGNRLEQEMVMFAQKMDVSEELDRLGAHITEVRSVIKSNKPIGRRLDFLMQELNREANTLGSKSVDTETTRASVDLKVLIEQMREQVQNIE